MGRRRREPSLSDVLLDAPWWVSVALAAGSYIFLHAIVPAIFASSPYLAGIVMASRSFAWIPAIMFGFLGLLAYLRTRGGLAGGSVPLQRRGYAKGPNWRTGSNRTVHDKPSGAVRQSDTSNHTTASPPNLTKPTEWSVDALGQLEWKRFEMLCVWYYEAMGFTVTTVSHGADGGIDATLFKEGMSDPIAVVQCKAWRSPVKVEPVRALGGVMHSKKAKRGVFWSLTGFIGRPVKDYAAEAGIQLLDGAGIVERIRLLDQYKQATLLAKAFKGDYRTPTCAACGVKMVEREGKNGPFWGCTNYPKGCRVRLPRMT